MVTAHWLKDDSDAWISGELLQFVTVGSEVLAAVVLPVSKRVGLISYDKLRIGDAFPNTNFNPEG